MELGFGFRLLKLQNSGLSRSPSKQMEAGHQRWKLEGIWAVTTSVFSSAIFPAHRKWSKIVAE